jgi:hypothetical protein
LSFHGLAGLEHAERDAGLQTQRLHRGDHLGDARPDRLSFRPAPGGAHAEARGALVPGGFGGGDDIFGFQQGFLLDLAMVRRLRAVAAILRAAAGLDRKQGGALHGIRVMVLAVHLLGAEHQVVEGQFKQGNQRLDGPARSGNESGGLNSGLGSGGWRSSRRTR